MAVSLVQTVNANSNSSIPGNSGATATQPPTPLVMPMVTSNGSMLVAWLSLGLDATQIPVNTPSFTVADSAGNFWIPVVNSVATFSGARASMWVCFNALPVTWVSTSLTGYASSECVAVSEFTGVPAFPQIDFVSLGTPAFATAITATGTASQSDTVLSMAAIGSTAFISTTPTGNATTFIASYNTGGSNPNGCGMAMAWGSMSAGAMSETWTLGAISDMATIAIGISTTNYAPTQKNTNIPTAKVEMSFGSTPSDPSMTVGTYSTGTLPANGWTDITSRCIGKGGEVAIQGTSGRTYELSQPEAGTCAIGLNNWDGAFNPNNTSSPYYPNVQLNTPVRVSALWNGRYYPVWSGYVAKWPQDWPDLPQFGLSKMQATDIVSVASALNMPSAVQGEILADQPYACFPFSEQYTETTQPTNQVGSILTPIDANGLIALNTSLNNQRTATYMDGNPVTVNSGVFNGTAQPILTGQSLSLLGDNGTGMGVTSYGSTSGPDTNFRGPGAIYADQGGPATTAVTYECWYVPQPWDFGVLGGTNGNQQVNILEVYGPPVWMNAITGQTQNPLPLLALCSEKVAVSNDVYDFVVRVSPNPSVPVVSYQYQVNTSSTAGTGLMGTPVHLMVTLNAGTVGLWVNGILQATGSYTFPSNVPPVGYTFGCARWPFSWVSQNYNYTMAYGTMYPYVLPAVRAYNHYLSGATGFAGDTSIARLGRMIAWSTSNVPYASFPQTNTYPVTLGAAYDTAGQSLATALNNVAVADNGAWFATRTGVLMYAPGQALYNQASAITFGDSNTAGAEVPYLPSFGLDYDNTYVQSISQVTQENGPNTLLSPIVKNTTSENEYFRRGPQSVTASTSDGEDVLDNAYWRLNKQAQPSVRCRTLTVDAASNPSVFSKVLPLNLGNAAVINRRPMGASGTYSLSVILEKISFNIGPSVWNYNYVASPYTTDGEVLQCDASGNDVLGNNVLAW